MLISYLKLAIRLLRRNPFFSLINILGLSIGFASFFVLWQYASSELKSDQFLKDYDNIVRLAFNWTTRNDFGDVHKNTIGGFVPGFCEALVSEYDDFETYTRLYTQLHFDRVYHADHGAEIFLSHITENYERVAFKETRLAYGDPNLFEFFGIPLVEGSPETVLREPNTIVVSEAMANKYFGRRDIAGSLLFINDSIPLKITGVFENLPQNTHLEFDAVISTERIKIKFNQLHNSSTGATLYFRVKENKDLKELNRKIDITAKKFLAPQYQKFDLNPEDNDFFTQPVTEIVFSNYSGDSHKLRSKSFLHALRVVSIVILVIAWINYLNLVIYANSKRMKEMGVRKTSGAKNVDFIAQFITESVVMNFISILAAFTFVQSARAPLQNLLQFHLSSATGISGAALLTLAIVTLAGILITGIYPALSTIKRSTKKIFTDAHRHDLFVGRWLTVFQFSAAIILMIAVFSIYFQVGYILKKDLGIKRNEVIVIDLPENPASYPRSQLNGFLQRLSSINGITDFALSSSTPGDDNKNGIGIQRSTGSNFIGVDTNGGVDERFLPFFGIKLLAGRNFINDDPGNEHSIIVSRKVLQRLGLGEPDDAVGQVILVEAKEWTHDMVPTTIIGVIEDYFRKPLLVGVQTAWSNETGVALTYHDYVDAENEPQKVSMIIRNDHFNNTLGDVKNLYDETFEKSLFTWYFLNDHLNQHYENEKIARNQLMVFVLLAVGIACLGLLGMIANKAEEKTKEIGIRKVLGARLAQIAQMLLNTTIRQIIISAVVGVPAAHFLVQEYLQRYSERITLQWWHYAVPVFVLLLILFLTVASTLRKAARSNPVESLRYE